MGPYYEEFLLLGGHLYFVQQVQHNLGNFTPIKPSSSRQAMIQRLSRAGRSSFHDAPVFQSLHVRKNCHVRNKLTRLPQDSTTSTCEAVLCRTASPSHSVLLKASISGRHIWPCLPDGQCGVTLTPPYPGSSVQTRFQDLKLQRRVYENRGSPI